MKSCLIDGMSGLNIVGTFSSLKVIVSTVLLPAQIGNDVEI